MKLIELYFNQDQVIITPLGKIKCYSNYWAFAEDNKYHWDHRKFFNKQMVNFPIGDYPY